MALSWAPQHLAGVLHNVSGPCSVSGRDLESEPKIGNQHSAVCSRAQRQNVNHWNAPISQCRAERLRARRNWLRGDQKRGMHGQREGIARSAQQYSPEGSSSIVSDSNDNCDISSSVPAAAERSGVHMLVRTALLVIPLLFISTISSGPAFAVEPQAETLNTIIVPPGGGHLSLGQRVAVALRSLGLPDWVTIILVAALPVVELRGAIPVGYWLGLKPVHVYALAILGNMLPIPFVIAYIGKVSDWLVTRSSLARKFFDWLFARTRSRADLMVKYRTLGLTLFVAVPLPLTGAWSGAIGAHLLGLPFWESIAANLVGVMIAGVIVTVLCQLGWAGAVIAGVGLFTAAIAAFWTSWRKKETGQEPIV